MDKFDPPVSTKVAGRSARVARSFDTSYHWYQSWEFYKISCFRVSHGYIILASCMYTRVFSSFRVCFVFRLFSCLYRYTRNTIHETRRFRVSCSQLCFKRCLFSEIAAWVKARSRDGGERVIFWAYLNCFVASRRPRRNSTNPELWRHILALHNAEQ